MNKGCQWINHLEPMKTNLLHSFIDKHWKTLLLIISLLIGVILIYPVSHLFPIVYNVISTDLSRRVNNYQPETISDHRTQIEGQNLYIFLPLVQISNQELASPLPENRQNNNLQEIDISPTGEKISIIIVREEGKEPLGSELTISFLPGEQCHFGDGRACMYKFDDSNDNNVILASVHSGMGGEGESFRDFIEGTGINHGLFSTDQVAKNIQSITNSEIHINQGETIINGLVLHDIVRIPPAFIEKYLSLPVDQTLTLIDEITGRNLGFFNQDLFILETCGWRLPDENHHSDYPNSMQSIYLGIFRFQE